MIKTLIADDSALAREIIRDFLEEDESFTVIGEAYDGEDAISKILSLNPDLVTLDIEMPKKTGLEVIESVLKVTNIPIVVISSHGSAKTAYEATLKGALEFYPKSIFSSDMDDEKKREIYDTLKRISGIKTRRENFPSFNNTIIESGKRKINAVLIASSTGGPKALAVFFNLLPENFKVPIIIVQHNTSGFDESFVQWLDTYTILKVKLAEEGEAPAAGNVYIAHTDKHLEVKREGDRIFFHYNNSEPENNQKPAADVLFRTAAESYGDSLISIVLTGMGHDGARGTKHVRDRGGITLAQDEESSLIYGMPKAARDTGCVDMVLPLEKIPQELLRLTQ